MPKFLQVPPQEPSHYPPRIAFVAEAPSHDELSKGQPLVGPSGRIFNSILRTAQLDRAEFAITNVFNEKLPDNDVSNWCIGLRDARARGLTDLPPIGSAGFLAPDYRHHLLRLNEELTRWQPTVVVPLGGTALWALTGSASISTQRGTVNAATQLAVGMKLLPTFHPAAVMHQWKLFTVVVGDILKAMREAEKGPQIVLPKRELLLEPTLADIDRYIPRLLNSDEVSVDIETGWGQITCIGFAPDAEHAICIPFLDKRKLDRNYWRNPSDEVGAWERVRDVMASPVPKLGQNFGSYDTYWLLRKKRIAPVNFREDTRLRHHALYPELPKSLLFMGASYTQQGSWKHWGHSSNTEKRDD